MKVFIYWLPRVSAILFILFISVFALDVFTEPNWALALFMHLIPSFILIILTGLGMGIFFHSIIFAIPSVVIGVFFFVSSGTGRRFD
jgi:hypothetical protein